MDAPSHRKLVVGNWKMNGALSTLPVLGAINQAALAHPDVDVGVAVPATLLIVAGQTADNFQIGAQDIHPADQGPHTGRISALMVKDAGASFTLVGHSECRTDHRESNEAVRLKACAALRHGLSVIICVGETLADREASRAEQVVAEQLSACLPPDADGTNLAIAYEPIWAIGTGRIPSAEEITAMHDAIRTACVDALGAAGEPIRVLYGGSVSTTNAAEIFATPKVDGVLVGGASLTAEAFIPIIAAA